MATSLSTETALLVELLGGPGYGLNLIQRVQVHSQGQIRLRQGVVYPALRDFNRRKLVRQWSVVTPGSGRPRTYYELTTEGIAVAQAHRSAIASFARAAESSRRPARSLATMKARLFECGEVAEAAMWLRRAGSAKRR